MGNRNVVPLYMKHGRPEKIAQPVGNYDVKEYTNQSNESFWDIIKLIYISRVDRLKPMVLYCMYHHIICYNIMNDDYEKIA